MTKQLKRFLPDVLAVLLFVVLAFAYFFPADIEGRILYRHDASAGVGAGQEHIAYYQRTGHSTRWTNALFSGMPTYQLAPGYESTSTLSYLEKAYHLWLPENVWFLFVYLLGFYILLRAFDFRQHLAALGSVLWAFSTYFLIIIAAGHIWKVWALAYLPPMIAGIVLAYRGKYLWGMLATALFTAMEVHANHVQMTYYFLSVILLLVLAFVAETLQKGANRSAVSHLLKATSACFVGGLLGVLVNLSSLYHTWEYGQESMRGKSELVKEKSADQTSSGLERSYITNYSYGIGETWSLLVPNVKGGASDRLLGSTPQARKEGSTHFFNVGGQQIPYSYLYDQMPQYWNESTLDQQQPGTSGPVYVGAFVLMLFVLGLFIVRSPVKWALLGATVLSIMLAWGQNFMGLTNFFIDYVPLYAKFRTVESILVVAEFCIPLLAMLALKEWVSPTVDGGTAQTAKPQPREQRGLLLAFALTAGPALLFALMPSAFFNFTTGHEVAQFNEMLGPEAGAFVENLQTVRKGIFTADAWRSFAIILIGAALLVAYKRGQATGKPKLSPIALSLLLLVLCLADLWPVNKRYLNDEMFVPKSQREQKQPLTETDKYILQDPSLDYRVLNLASNTFNENETSYYHKSIGGYHAAKLRRYQELIEAHISPEMHEAMTAIIAAGGDMTQVAGDSLFPVLNMLNARYFILPLQKGQTIPMLNPYAYGNAWFVDEVVYADNANEELDALGRLPLRRTAVSDKRYERVLGTSTRQDSVSIVTISKYEPNQLTYKVSSTTGGVVVFSEIFYPGWTATIDGQEAELGRADYVLRALNVGPGEHEVVLSFFPKTVDRTETIAYIALGLLLLLAVLVVFLEIKQRKTTDKKD